MGYLRQIPPLRVQETAKKGRGERMEDSKESRPSRRNRAGKRVNTRSLRQQAQGLQGSAPDGVLELKGEVDACPTPGTEAIST